MNDDYYFMELAIEEAIMSLNEGGIPIGAVCAKAFVAAGFEPGDHGTTFGGNPLATAAGCAVFEIFEEENLVENSTIFTTIEYPD